MSMDIFITETGKTEQLSIIDAASGVDWICDLLGNHDALPEYDEETDSYRMDQEVFDWWKNLTAAYQAADNRCHELLSLAPNEDMQKSLHEISADLGSYPEAVNSLCDSYEGVNQ